MPAGNGVCNTVYLGDPAVQLTYDAWGVFQQYAHQGYTLAVEQIQGLNQFQVEFHRWDASFAADGTLSGFRRPDKPALVPVTPVDLSGQIPNAPTVAVPPIVLDPAPAPPAALTSPPDLNLTLNPPAPLGATRPGAAPALVVPDAPAEPVLAAVAKPGLTSVTLPTAPEITILPFAEPVPLFDAPLPSGVIDFTESPYTSVLLDGLRARITAMLDGQGLPPQVDAALFGQLVERDDRSALKLAQEVREEFAARGFEPLPAGILDRRLWEVRQENRNKRAEHNREVYLQAQRTAVENIRLAVSNGLQLEGTLIQAHMQIEQRKFDLQVQLQQTALAVFNARATAYNAAVQAYNARVEAYRTYLEGQRARAEVYRSQVEAAKLAGELNEQQVRIYEAEVRAELQKVEVYRAQVEGFRNRIEAERLKIEGHRSEVEAYRAYVDAYRAEWEAERTRIEAEIQRGRIYQTLVEGYAAMVNVWRAKGEAKIEEHRANLVAVQSFLQQHDAQVRTVLAKLEAARANVQAQVATNESLVRMYQAEAGVESTAVDADTRAFNAMAERENMRLQVLLKDAELQIHQLTQRANLLLRAMESSATASAQLAASAMSAVNMSASVGSSVSRGENCSTAFTYSGEIADA